MEKLNVITASSVRELIKNANELGITKNELVTIEEKNGQWFLIYSK